MTAQEIIAKFEQYVDDNSTMSTQETLDLLNKVYHRVLDSVEFEFLKKEYSGTHSSGEITLPSDFKNFAMNYDDDYESEQVIFVGTSFAPYRVIPFSERRNYRDASGYAYLDARQGKIVFTKTPDQTAVEFDYMYQPDDLTTSDTPVFDARFHDILYHGMAIDFNIIDNTPKNRSYAEEHQNRYNQLLEDLIADNFNRYGRTNY